MKLSKQLIIETLRSKPEISLGEVIDDAQQLSEKNLKENLDILRSIRISDIFNYTSISSPEECLDEMIKHKHLIKNKSISEIQELLKCDLKIIGITIKNLKGGWNGYAITPSGIRRGMRYTMHELGKESDRIVFDAKMQNSLNTKLNKKQYGISINSIKEQISKIQSLPQLKKEGE